MKKFLLSCLILLSVIILTGCWKSNDNSETTVKFNQFVLVNKSIELPSNWEDYLDLMEVQNVYNETIKIDKETYEQFQKLRSDLLEEGIDIELDSAYRSVEKQQEIRDTFENEYGLDYTQQYVATPGHSEHHTSLSVDIVLVKDGNIIGENDEMLAETEIFNEIHKKLAKYGFILRYPEGKEDVTGYAYSPWGLRYIGSSDIAQEIMNEGLALEEYLDTHEDVPATIYCEKNGGKIEIVEESGLCIFNDGSYCEEWSYVNHECQPGEIIYNTISDNINTEDTETTITPEMYSEEELTTATDVITDTINDTRNMDIEIQNVTYLGDQEAADSLEYCQQLNPNIEECAVFTSDFHIPEDYKGATGIFEPNTDITGWMWYLGRINDEWVVVTQGLN